jgi:hypothetical protein
MNFMETLYAAAETALTPSTPAGGGGVASPGAVVGGSSSQPAMWESLLPFAAIFVVMYFLVLRPQSKKLKDQAEFIKNFSPFIHQGNISLLTEEINTAHYHIERNANPKILFMDLSVKMNGLLNIPKN